MDIKINPLQPKRVPKPVRREPAGPTLYNVVSLVPLELESNEGIAVIEQGQVLCNVILLYGIDPELVTKQLGTDIEVVGGVAKSVGAHVGRKDPSRLVANVHSHGGENCFQVFRSRKPT